MTYRGLQQYTTQQVIRLFRELNRISNATIIDAEGDDNIENKGSNVTINGGVGNDVIVNNDVNVSEVTINGNAGNDHISKQR